jgi:nicotinamide-nucleotide amidase
MEAWFAGRIDVTAIQLRQVRVPGGARVFENPVGLAPAFEVQLAGVPVICLPGFPREIHAIYDRGLAARLAELREAAGDQERIARQIYRAFGRGESQLAQACEGLVSGVAGASIHYQVKFPETLVKLVVRDPSGAAATARLGELDSAIRDRLAPYLYGTGDESLVERTTRRLIEAKRTVATAESCTGGLAAELLTRMPGSSNVFPGGVIAYANEQKHRLLGVRPATIEADGAVSQGTASEMAAGALRHFGTDLAVAISGVAGPGGGTPEKPVGTVWIALATRSWRDRDDIVIATRKLAWPSTRDQIRLLSAWWALAMVDAAVPGEDPRELARARWVLGDVADLILRPEIT